MVSGEKREKETKYTETMRIRKMEIAERGMEKQN
jgi:hypothetical protein